MIECLRKAPDFPSKLKPQTCEPPQLEQRQGLLALLKRRSDEQWTVLGRWLTQAVIAIALCLVSTLLLPPKTHPDTLQIALQRTPRSLSRTILFSANRLPPTNGFTSTTPSLLPSTAHKSGNLCLICHSLFLRFTICLPRLAAKLPIQQPIRTHNRFPFLDLVQILQQQNNTKPVAHS